MTADILKFESRSRDAGGQDGVVRGDIIVSLWHEELSLWCAWPVEVVGADGRALMLRAPNGQAFRAGDVLSGRDDLILRRADHQGAAFNALCHKVFQSREIARATFAAVAL